VRPGRPGLAEGGSTLPDEEPVSTEHPFRWAPGALDGVLGHHSEQETAEAQAREVVDALRALTRRATDPHAAELYRVLAEHQSLGYVDALLPLVAEDGDLDAERVHAVARWLALGAADREPVKTALALLGIVSGGGDRELLLTLGRHDEFTLFVVVALLNTDPAPERTLLELGQNVSGWGRVHVVERLADTRDDQVRAWLLREGYRNEVMWEYTALACAQGGDLAGALRLPDPDDALLRGAGDLLSTLVAGRGGPAAGIGDYPEGAEVAELYLRHLQERDLPLEWLPAVRALRDFVDETEGEAHDPALGWPERRGRVAALADAVLRRPEWEARVRAGLDDPDRDAFAAAAEAAGAIGLDPWDAYYARLAGGRGESGDWWHLARTPDAGRLERVVRLAEARLPLERIAAGPAEEMGLGPEFAAHSALDFVLQELGRLPGRGWALVRAGLRSPVVRNRNLAVNALAEWGREAWPPEAEPLLRTALAEEPNEGARDWLRRLLEGRPLRDDDDE
ncbi:MAG TPA: hypothetical protein VFX98_18805, partial [Longimicrobiaceae bacterium]|nr:hypothetical protein [Longimicrobiaceae bacterium]